MDDVNKLYENQSPLYHAIINGNLEMTKILIDAGLNLKPLSPSTKSPLFLASEQKNPEIAKILIESGARIESRIEGSILQGKGNIVLNLKEDFRGKVIGELTQSVLNSYSKRDTFELEEIIALDEAKHTQNLGKVIEFVNLSDDEKPDSYINSLLSIRTLNKSKSFSKQ
jgi:ankyrin repeat protein